jgi:anti-sigma B factor antagonist
MPSTPYQFKLSTDGKHLDIEMGLPRLEAMTIGSFKNDLENQWKPSIESVSVNCEQIEFVDSSGIGALLSIQKRMPQGAAVVLKKTKPAVLSVIELLCLHRVFKLENN